MCSLALQDRAQIFQIFLLLGSLQKKVTAHKCSRMSTFPDYLIIQLKKFTVGADWVPKKLGKNGYIRRARTHSRLRL